MYGVLHALCFSRWSVYYWSLFFVTALVPPILLWWHGRLHEVSGVVVIPLLLAIMVTHMWYRKLRGLPLPAPRR